MRRAAALLAALALAACGPAAPPPSERTVLDAFGNAVPLPREVRRVVTTLPGLTETVVALGAGDRLVAVAEAVGGGAEGEDPARPRGVPSIAVSPAVSPEAVARTRPDLLLVDPTLLPEDFPRLSARFPGTFGCDSRTLDALEATWRRLGEALGAVPAADRLVADLRAARASSRLPSRPKVLLLAWADPPMALGPGALLDDMLREVGAENVASDLGRASGEFASERVVARAPDVILLTGGDFPDALRARWASVPAVRDGRVHDLGGSEFVRAGPRTAAALRRLSEVLAPKPAEGGR